MRWLEVHRHWLTKIGGGSAGPVTGGEAEGARGELVLFHQGGGVQVHAHGDHGVGVAQPLGDGADCGLLGQQPDRVGVAQVVEMRPLLVGPCLVQAGGGQGALPDAGEVG